VLQEIPSEVVEMVERRQQARQSRNWADADMLRDALKQAGYVVKDTPEGPVVTPVT